MNRILALTGIIEESMKKILNAILKTIADGTTILYAGFSIKNIRKVIKGEKEPIDSL